MIMTENEAIKDIQFLARRYDDLQEVNMSVSQESLDMAIQALEEIQEYRVLGTTEEIREIYSLCNILQNVVKDYSAIGTVEEFKALKLGRLGNKGFITIGQTMEEYTQEIRNKAIYEFKEALKEELNNYDFWKQFNKSHDWIVEHIAEQMKGDAEC